MAVPKKMEDFNAEDRVDLKLLEHGTHYLCGEIDTDSIQNCIRWILYENLGAKEEKVLTLYINSTGGDLYEAMALIDVMKASQHTIRVIGIGAVMSAAFLIFASGTKGYRLAAKNTSFMCHQYSDHLQGKHHDLKATMRDGDLTNQRMINVLKDATGLPATRIKSKLLSPTDVYLTAVEVVDLGVADDII